MAIPSNFNTWEHLQALLMSLQNRMVTEEFRDVEDLDNITTPRSSLKSACWLRDADTAVIALVKMFLFHVIIKGIDFTELEALITSSKPEGLKRKTLPKVTLYFANTRNLPADKRVWRQISFRIPEETSETFTRTEAIRIANKIKTLFPTTFSWETGKILFSYAEWNRGYQFQLLAFNETEAKKVIDKVLDIQSHSPNWSYFNTISNDQPSESYPDTPPTIHILGDPYKEHARRPKTTVSFQYATLALPPRKPVFLYDRRGLARNPLVS